MPDEVDVPDEVEVPDDKADVPEIEVPDDKAETPDVETSGDSLFEVEPDWQQHWKGMPDYSHQDLMPDSTLLVHFKTKQDRAAFAALIGQTLGPKTKFVWHPQIVIGRVADKVFTAAKVTPRYPIYIISKGRWESRLTSKAFEWAKVPYHICVEPQEYDRYAAVIDPAKILTLPFSNLGLGGIPARNWVWEHARATGALRHWIFDDNISGFCRFQDNLKVEVDSGVLHCAIEDFADRYENIKMAAFNYDYFAPRKQGARIRPITWNTRCYSGILLSNDLKDAEGNPMQWRGRYNEDTDLSLRILKDGWCTALFNAFLMYKKPTLTMKGGNTDELYAGVEATAAEWESHAASCGQCKQTTDGYDSRTTPCETGRQILSKDGRWLMAESLREQHPDQTTVERKWQRWQHAVDYRRFQIQLGINVPKLRDDVTITESEYGMSLDIMPPDQAGGPGLKQLASRPEASPAPVRKTSRPEEQQPVRASRPEEPIRAPSPVSALAFAFTSRPEPTAEPARAVSQSQPAAIEKTPAAPEQPSTPEEQQPGGGPGAEEDLPFPAEEPRPDHAIALRDSLLARGHRLLTRDGKFFVSESSTLTDDDRAAIKLHREALIQLAVPWIEEPPVVEQTSLFEEPRQMQTTAQFIGNARETARYDASWRPDEPPDLTGIDEIVLNFATDGLDWVRGARPGGVTVSTLDGKLTRFLPFRFIGGNLDEKVVKRWAREQLRNKKIYGSKIGFDGHMGRVWGVNLDEQGCTFSDIQHTAALLDDGRKRFAIDILAQDYLPDLLPVKRLDESHHLDYHAAEAAERERYTAELVWRLKDVMYPELDKQELREVQAIEDRAIPGGIEMEANGAPIDEERLVRDGRECTRRHNELLLEISKEVGFAFSHTTKDWQRLFEVLHLPPTNGHSEAIISLIDHPTVKKAHLAAQYASLNSKVFNAYPKLITGGILHFELNQLRSDEGGTVSGRYSASPIQQVPNSDNHRAVFGDDLFPKYLYVHGPNGISYLEFDAKQIEQRLLVHYSNDTTLIKEYDGDLERLLRGEDTVSYHKVMWRLLKEYKPDILYSNVKSFNFARAYGARSIKLAVMMKFITEAEGNEIRLAKRWDDPRLKTVKEIEAAYKRAMPAGEMLLDRASHLAKPECDEYCKQGDEMHRQYQHRGYIKTLCGRRSRFKTGYKTYIALNRAIQGTGSDILKTKIAELHDARKETGFVMRMTVHDAVTGDAMLHDTMQRVSAILNHQSFPLKVPILWSSGQGRSWAECK